MAVRTAEAEGIDAGPQRRIFSLPVFHLRIYIDGRVLGINKRIRGLIVQGRRDFFMLQRQYDFEQ
ncbi:hypothetical protein D3C73_1438990 [compost metagenome]